MPLPAAFRPEREGVEVRDPWAIGLRLQPLFSPPLSPTGLGGWDRETLEASQPLAQLLEVTGSISVVD